MSTINFRKPYYLDSRGLKMCISFENLKQKSFTIVIHSLTKFDIYVKWKQKLFVFYFILSYHLIRHENFTRKQNIEVERFISIKSNFK